MANATAEHQSDLFDWGPPMRLQKAIGLVKPDKRRIRIRILLVVLISWVPLAVLAGVQTLTTTSQTARTFLSDFGVHARYLIAAPALILAEADCIPRLGLIASHFLDAGLISKADLHRYEHAVSSTRRLLKSAVGDVLVVGLAYGIVIALLLYVSPEELPAWRRGSVGKLSVASYWHVLVSLPLLLILFFGWLWRLALWGRFLFLMARLDLQLIPSHPDRVGGLKFVSSSLRRFRLISFAMGAVVAGTIANRVVHHGHHPLRFENFAIGLIIFILIFFVGPLTIFVSRLRQTKVQGIIKYGSLAGFVGSQFEAKWLSNPASVDKDSLSASDFSATTDLYAVTANVYEIRDVPFGLRDLVGPIVSSLIPFIPIALLAVPLEAVVDSLFKLLL